ncbi:MAG: DUF4439 domain-containing protein [Specibacter sp.]
MTNPSSPADSAPNAPAVAVTAAPVAAAKPSRKGPRRATAPAGAPAKARAGAPALLVIGADGMIVPTPAPYFSAAEAAATDSAAPASARSESAVPAVPYESTPAESAPQEPHDAGHCPAADPARTQEAPAPMQEAVQAPVAEEEHAKPGAADRVSAGPGTAQEVDVPEAAIEQPGGDSTHKPLVDAEPSVAADLPDDAAGGPAPGQTGAAVEAETDVKAADSTDGTAKKTIPAAVADAENAVPLSRRERRLAEEGAASGVAVASPAAAVAAAGAAAASARTAAPESGLRQRPEAPRVMQEPRKSTGKRRGKIISFVRAALFLLVISALVMGLGTVLTGHDEATVGPTQTEAKRQAAWEKTTALLAQTTQLGSSAGGPKVQELLGQTAGDLAVQAAALGDGLPANTSGSSTTAPAPATLTQFLLALHANGEELLGNALSADHAMGRVFAAVGTSQLLQSHKLSVAVGSTPQPSKFLPARIDFPAPKGPTCKSTLEPRTGATIDAALRAAALAEQKAVYAYQVSTTRFAEPQFSSAAQLLARHGQKLQALNAELALRCLPPAAPVAGFALDPAFTATPVKALARLEAELGTIYGDLAALSPAPTVPPAAPASAAATTGPAATAPTQEPSTTAILREMSVAWLLDSAQTQSIWGGTVGALPGLAEAPLPAAATAP